MVLLHVKEERIGEPVQLVPLGEGRFRFEAPRAGGPVGETVNFEEKDGEVVRMRVADYWYEPIDGYAIP